MARPVIGLTTYVEHVKFRSHDGMTAVLQFDYVAAVRDSGGQPVLIPPHQPDVAVLDRLDGLILTGGSDVDSLRYGEVPHPATASQPDRDSGELALLAGALERDLPLLGICRGLQLMVVAAGGRLHQHLPDLLGHSAHRPTHGPKYGEHRVRLAAGTLGHRVLGDEVVVNSLHHQGIADAGSLTAVGWCPDDDLIEVAEDPTRTFALGVQWHPEESADRRLFEAVVAAAAVRVGG